MGDLSLLEFPWRVLGVQGWVGPLLDWIRRPSPSLIHQLSTLGEAGGPLLIHQMSPLGEGGDA